MEDSCVRLNLVRAFCLNLCTLKNLKAFFIYAGEDSQCSYKPPGVQFTWSGSFVLDIFHMPGLINPADMEQVKYT